MNRRVLALLGLALAARVIALTYVGNPFDMNSFQLTGAALGGADPFGLYSDASLDVQLFANADPLTRWPYPGGYLPVVGVAQFLAGRLGHFDILIRLPTLLADFALAALLYRHLARTSPDRALAGAAIVLLGPLFIAISSLHGQLDTITMLFVAAALMTWTRLRPGTRRAVYAGLLLGAGAAIKTFPLVFLVALAPAARDPREAVALVASAVAVPVLTLVPFLVADPGGVLSAVGYSGVAGQGGLSLLVQPGLVESVFAQRFEPTLSDASLILIDLARPLVVVALCGCALWVRRHRDQVWTNALLVIAVLFLASFNTAYQYGIWAVVLLLFANRMRAAAVLQGLLLLPAFVSYTAAPAGGYGELVVDVLYVPVMVGLPFALLVLALRRPAGAIA